MRNRNSNLRISRAPLKAKRSINERCFESKGFQRVVHGKLRSNYQRVREDRVAVKVGSETLKS